MHNLENAASVNPPNQECLNKIFISYRRQDAAANALGIGQYLEKEFGRKNVFIDVDMRAGAIFQPCSNSVWPNARLC